ncbi:hypothetical protein CNR22_00040 [Sphingobacteriaceae bacterium]|nr:hypothetical protein CNR22_00040 [Sphingobacteriaceae bacterium]
MITVTNSAYLCFGQSFTLSHQGADTYSSEGSGVVSPSSNSNYTVTGFSQQVCSSLISPVANIQVLSLPALTLSGPNSVCSGSTISQLVSTSAPTFTWNTGSTANPIAFNSTVTSVCSITVKGSNGCKNEMSKTITVNDLT